MSLKHNVLANIVGSGWSTLITIIFVPVYIKYLGIEAYGVVGVFILLQSCLDLLDAGLNPVLNREMARSTSGAHTEKSIRDLLRSIELITLALVFSISIVIWVSSDWLAESFVKTQNMSVEAVANAFVFMGVFAALRLVEKIYISALYGLQRQVALNAIISASGTVKALGAIAVLKWVSPTLEAFFLWQIIVTIITALFLSLLVYRSFPTSDHRGKFSISSLDSIKGFAGGMMGISFVSLLLVQADKVILINILSLAEYGYYYVAFIAASGLRYVIYPLHIAFYPKFCGLIASGSSDGARKSFHLWAQLTSVLAGSIAIFSAFFSRDLLLLWTRDPLLSEETSTLFAILITGNMFNLIVTVLYNVMHAHAWTRLLLFINTCALIVIIPSIYVCVNAYGGIGAACVWLFLNIGYVLILPNLASRKILTAEFSRWYIQDVFVPLVTSLLVILAFTQIPLPVSVFLKVIWLSGIVVITIFCSGFVAPMVRKEVLKLFCYLRGRYGPSWLQRNR